MPRRDPSPARRAPNLSFMLLIALLVILWIAGGASRADVFGQVVTRGAAWMIAIAAILFMPRPQLRGVAPVALFVLAAVLLVALQLIPLPPSLWLQLPGRELLAQAAIVSGQEQPWRPLSVSPEATVNALSSLVVPVVALFLAAGLSWKAQWRVVTVLLGLVIASCLVGLLQFSGARFDHPLINDVSGAVSASFANRNHFALFAAIGCLLAPAWAFREGDHARWKGLAAVGLLLFFALIILATGSRMGALVGALAFVLGPLSVRRRIGAELKRFPRKASLAVAVASAGLLIVAIALSVTLDRAISIERALTLEAGEDLRGQALPTVLGLIGQYFPFGSGFGAFDPVYRIAEPSGLLSILYFNHVHNDLLEVVLDGGIFGLSLLGAAVAWWAWKSMGAWRTGDGSQGILPRLGSGTLLLILIASVADYPARTPMIMAVIILAAVWLNGEPSGAGRKSSAAAHNKADR